MYVCASEPERKLNTHVQYTRTCEIQIRRIPKVTAPLLSDLASPRSRYFRIAVTYGWSKNVDNCAVILHKEDTLHDTYEKVF